MKKYEITYHLQPDAENITIDILANTEEEAIEFAKEYRKEGFSIKEKIKYEYEGDNRILTMEDIEKILIRVLGGNRDSGCYHNGRWMSINTILEAISKEI